MHAWDITVTVPNRPGTLAAIATAFGEAHINLESVAGFRRDGGSELHVLVTDRDAARRVIEGLGSGHSIVRESEVVLTNIENRPGALGEICRRIADDGIDLSAAYLATDTRLVLGADDLPALERRLSGAAGATSG